MSSHRDLVSVIESIYRVDVTDDVWLDGILATVRPVLDEGLGVSIELFDASTFGTLRRKDVNAGFPAGVYPVLERMLQELPPNAFEAGYRGAWDVETASSVDGFDRIPVMKEGIFPSFGIQDCFLIKSSQPGNVGCQISAFRSRRTRPTPKERALWSRVAAHLGAGYRIRRRLEQRAAASAPLEAILDVRGNTHHAEGHAKATVARATLRNAVLAVERARHAEREDPIGATSSWRPLVSARWTLLDHFDSDGKRYVVARENEPLVAEHPALTSREQQVASFACLGHSNKLIAYHLGISHSTVRVLLSRASSKLGVASRKELIERLRANGVHRAP